MSVKSVREDTSVFSILPDEILEVILMFAIDPYSIYNQFKFPKATYPKKSKLKDIIRTLSLTCTRISRILRRMPVVRDFETIETFGVSCTTFFSRRYCFAIVDDRVSAKDMIYVASKLTFIHPVEFEVKTADTTYEPLLSSLISHLETYTPSRLLSLHSIHWDLPHAKESHQKLVKLYKLFKNLCIPSFQMSPRPCLGCVDDIPPASHICSECGRLERLSFCLKCFPNQKSAYMSSHCFHLGCVSCIHEKCCPDCVEDDWICRSCPTVLNNPET